MVLVLYRRHCFSPLFCLVRTKVCVGQWVDSVFSELKCSGKSEPKSPEADWLGNWLLSSFLASTPSLCITFVIGLSGILTPGVAVQLSVVWTSRPYKFVLLQVLPVPSRSNFLFLDNYYSQSGSYRRRPHLFPWDLGWAACWAPP